VAPTCFPAEVEAALSEHTGLVDAVAIGLPDPEWGHRVHAIVQPVDVEHPPSDDELRAHCKARLASYKVPKSFEAVQQLPRTAAGKVNRTRLADERESAAS
jgi:bile acid-coenzyme A ligase